MMAAHAHASQRAAERYQLTMTSQDCDYLASTIRMGGRHVQRLRRDSKRPSRVWYAIWIGGKQWMAVVYDHVDQTIVTCLPSRELKRWDHKLNRAAERLGRVCA